MKTSILSHWKYANSILLVSTAGVSAGNLYAKENVQSIKWNILVLMTDMQNVHYLGCDYQTTENIRTPNLDKLAKDGLNFRKAYDAVPVSAPTRASLLTGTYPMKHGQLNMMGKRY